MPFQTDTTWRRQILLLLLLILGQTVPSGSALAAKPEVSFIDPAGLKAMLGDPRLLIIDVRLGDFSSHNKIAGAVRYSPDDVSSWAPGLPRDKKIVLYCS